MSQPNRPQGNPQGNPSQGGQGGSGTTMIQPEQATRLLNVLKETLEQARQSSDPQVAQRYYARAEQIKQILLNYKRQQSAAAARNQAQGQAGASSAPQGSQVPGASNQAGAAGRNFAGNAQVNAQQRPIGQVPAQGQAQSPSMGQQQQAQQVPGQQMRQGAAGAAGVRQGSIPSSQVTPERYQQVRQRIQEVERKIQSLEAAKRADISPEQRAQIDSQLTEWKNKYSQFQRFANIIRGQLVEQARQNNAAQGNAGASMPASAAGPGSSAPGLGIQGQQASAPAPNAAAAAAAAAAQNAVQRPSVTQPNMGGAGSPPANRAGSPGSLTNPARASPATVPGAPTPGASAAQGAQSGMATPVPQGAAAPGKGSSTSPAPSSKDPGVPGVNLSGIIKPSVPSVPISSTINVKPPVPMTLKPGANNVRPTLTGGGASGLGQIMGTPAVMRMPTYDMATTTTAALTDNGGRVLTKRKLSELINTIGADEGDGRTTIDGDVEELLLDLADEFISSVTTFACRLAKHRKTDSVDVRDVQLHLERNWNIRIPGYAMDEIRSMRKWQPSSSYNQKVSGVEIAKAINGNMN